MPEVTIKVVGADYATWSRKGDAVAALAALRQQGLNVEDCVRIHPARNRFFRFWVIARPDALAEMTWLMRADGSWVRGRLYDGWADATWEYQPPADGTTIPATFTHVTRTVPHHGRQERYVTKSNGSCGRWVRGDDSVALCTCGWKTYGSTRTEVRAAARLHRDGALVSA